VEKTMRRSGRADAETVLHAQLDLAEAMVGNVAQGTKAYELMWGPLGGPAIEIMRMMLKAQRLYLEQLRGTLV
jgi:hypothetical protein